MEGVPSRFACLPDDDSTDWKQPKDKSKKGKSNSISTDAKLATAKTKKKNQSNNEAKELQQLAFQTSNKKSKNKNKSKSKNENAKSSNKESAQYEEWKEKDEKVIIFLHHECLSYYWRLQYAQNDKYYNYYNLFYITAGK